MHIGELKKISMLHTDLNGEMTQFTQDLFSLHVIYMLMCFKVEVLH